MKGGSARQQAQLQVIRLISSLINSRLINELSLGRELQARAHTTTGRKDKKNEAEPSASCLVCD